ncbi:MAG: (E)-4-hydroxy-3-methylbut-2-enyl-diphosphate synthase [Pyramidobacter sp.]|nr:(E)-4-hydroxy-3-methylbut-2-enyl-diphosphate synthase [Pyramidobacter sp.]
MKKTLSIGALTVGADAPIRVESMLKTRLHEIDSCLAQLEQLKKEGCELVRVAFPDLRLKDSLKTLNDKSPLPLMADIHFDPDIAVAAVEAGCPSIRINPGNMGSPERLTRVVEVARDRGVVIRIGANSGSISGAQLAAADGDRGAALALAVSEQMEMLLSRKFTDVIVSAKSTDIAETLRANVILKKRYGDFPFHVGITESGSGMDGLVKSACGLSRLFAMGIGDTMRVSLSQDPVDEVRAAYSILRALDLRQRGGRLISCPTCGRRQLDVADVVPELRELVRQLPDGYTVAVMGCEVNGPREARHAQLGVAGSPTGLVIFREGEIVARVEKGASVVEALRPYLPKRS